MTFNLNVDQRIAIKTALLHRVADLHIDAIRYDSAWLTSQYYYAVDALVNGLGFTIEVLQPEVIG